MEMTMPKTMWMLAGVIALAGGVAVAQTTRQMGALAVRDKAPTDKAIDLTQEDLAAAVAARLGSACRWGPPTRPGSRPTSPRTTSS